MTTTLVPIVALIDTTTAEHIKTLAAIRLDHMPDDTREAMLIDFTRRGWTFDAYVAGAILRNATTGAAQ